MLTVGHAGEDVLEMSPFRYRTITNRATMALLGVKGPQPLPKVRRQ
jgi:hypothetical protein